MVDEKFIAKQRKIIESSITKFENEIEQNKKYLELGNSDDESTQEFENFQEKQAFIKNAQKELSGLKKALQRIEEGNYDKCLKCDQPIERGRLEAFPAALYCVTHSK